MKNTTLRKLAVAVLMTGALALTTTAGTIIVPGTSDPWLAGMPGGSLDNLLTPEPADVAPAQSPVFAGSLAGGSLLTWSAAGAVGHPGEPAGPDGVPTSLTSHLIGANNGISDIISPINALLGVFLGPGQPDLNPAPATLDFSSAASWDYLSLAPALQQVFFMGDGLTSGSLPQTIVAPPGATRLYLGTMDGYGWANNSGDFRVTVNFSPSVPDGGSTLALLSFALVGFATLRRK